MDGHTYIYEYPPEEIERAVAVIKGHVEEGRLHPYAGLLLVHMGRNNEL